MRGIGAMVVSLSVLCFGFPRQAAAQSADNVAVVINDNSAASQVVGQHYVQKRAIPSTNVIRIHAPADETIDRSTYLSAIEGPIGAALARDGLQDRVLYIVLTKGVPLRISGSGGREGSMSSVDSELTLLYRRLTGIPVETTGQIANPYFLGTSALRDARRFSHREQDIYLVTRLDAFTVEEATTLVDTALQAGPVGRIVLDQRGALVARAGEDWLELTAQTIRSTGNPDRVMLETTPKPAVVAEPVLGYFSWGSTDPQLRKRSVGIKFAPGAIAGTFAGADARTFEPPPQEWVPMKDSFNRATWFAGSPQSLIGDLIREGVTGVSGNVAEPFLQGIVRPNVLFPAYLAGFNLAESFYLATPFLSWQTIIVGDPLCQPFPRNTLARADLEPPIDPATDLPEWFSARRVRVASAALHAEPKVAAQIVRAETRFQRGDRAGARAVLAQIVSAAPTLVAAQLRLAMVDEASGDHDGAIAGYRRVLEIQSNNVTALNNLAYNLAVYRNEAAAARPLALRAVNLSGRNATIVDTLAWIEHLLGNDTASKTLMSEAVRGAPTNADIRLHAAVVSAATGDIPAAEAHLKEALRRNPALERDPSVESLRERLTRGWTNR